jgi:isochorismate hydrolase
MAAPVDMFNVADPTTPGHYGPSQTALLLLDFHSMFVYKMGPPSAREALEVAAKMRAWAKTQHIPVIHCLIDVHATPFPTCKGLDSFAGIAAAMKSPEAGQEPAQLLEEDDEWVSKTSRSFEDPATYRRSNHPASKTFCEKEASSRWS